MDNSTLTVSLIIVAIYMSPSLIAYGRRHHARAQIILLNILLGWTFLGWVGALVWAAGVVKTSPKSA